jgi:hypothetical protein
MMFHQAQKAVTWLDENPSCQKEIYANRDGDVFIGDLEDAPIPLLMLSEKNGGWVEISRLDLDNLAERGEIGS